MFDRNVMPSGVSPTALLVTDASQLHNKLCSLWVASAALSTFASSIKCSVACNLLDISISMSITLVNPDSVSAGLPKVPSRSLKSYTVAGENTGGGWLL